MAVGLKLDWNDCDNGYGSDVGGDSGCDKNNGFDSDNDSGTIDVVMWQSVMQ